MNVTSTKKSKLTIILLIFILLLASTMSVIWAAPKFSDPEERIDSIKYLDSN